MSFGYSVYVCTYVLYGTIYTKLESKFSSLNICTYVPLQNALVLKMVFQGVWGGVFVDGWVGMFAVERGGLSTSAECRGAANSHPHSSSSVWFEWQALISYHPSHC